MTICEDPPTRTVSVRPEQLERIVKSAIYDNLTSWKRTKLAAKRGRPVRVVNAEYDQLAASRGE